jgi:hypothetical protein
LITHGKTKLHHETIYRMLLQDKCDGGKQPVELFLGKAVDLLTA